jgi:putative transposase
VDRYKRQYTVKRICRVLRFPRSTYYKAKNHKKSKREIFNNKLDQKILQIYYDSKRIYGAPKIQKILQKNNEMKDSLGNVIKVSVKLVQRRMKKLKIRSIVIKRFVNHRASKAKGKILQRENIINRNFETKTINEKWCGDITYIHVSNIGWTYLASVMDLHTNKIIGYSYSRKMDNELVIKALKNACMNSRVSLKMNSKISSKLKQLKNQEKELKKEKESRKEPAFKGLIFHSDLGSQYTSMEFNEILKSKGIIHSYSNKGTPYDNAKIESFHSVLKKEEVYVNHYKTFEEAKLRIFEYLESFYNRKRIHSALNYMTPQEKEDEAINKIRNNKINNNREPMENNNIVLELKTV